MSGTAVKHLCVDCQTDEAEGRLHGIRKLVTEKRCSTHERTRAKLARKGKRASTVLRTRGITAEQSHELLVFQGGVCWLCRRATGTSKALAHDHDHAHCSGPDSCPECLRGRLCSTCNRMLGHLRDDPGAFDRAAAYLRGDTPWRRLQASKQVFHVGDAVKTNAIAASEGFYSYAGTVDRINRNPPDFSKRTVHVYGAGEGGWWFDPMHLEPADV